MLLSVGFCLTPIQMARRSTPCFRRGHAAIGFVVFVITNIMLSGVSTDHQGQMACRSTPCFRRGQCAHPGLLLRSCWPTPHCSLGSVSWMPSSPLCWEVPPCHHASVAHAAMLLLLMPLCIRCYCHHASVAPCHRATAARCHYAPVAPATMQLLLLPPCNCCCSACWVPCCSHMLRWLYTTLCCLMDPSAVIACPRIGTVTSAYL